MNKFKLKNKIISLAGALVMLFAAFASVFSFAGTKKDDEFAYEQAKTHAAYTEADYVSYADDLLDEIDENNTNLYDEAYSLKEGYPILAENQTTSNLCWAYSGLKVLETTLMLQTQEYYNFSEMGVAYFAYLEKLSSTIDSFGSFRKLDETIKTRGIVNESDFSNDVYNKINETNHNEYSSVLKFADKNLPQAVAPIYLSRNTNFKTSNNEENIIKYYIKNVGALNIALPKGSMFRQDQTTANWTFEYNVTSANEGRNLNENHAVCLIGWNNEGFIGLNSWGVNLTESYEEVVIPYSVMNKYYRGEILFEGTPNEDWLCGYDYIGEENVQITSTSADEFTTEILERNTNPLKNVFLLTEAIEMSFQVSNVTNFETVYLNIFKGGEDVTPYFTISYDDANSIVNLAFTPKKSNFAPQATFFAGGSFALHFFEDVSLIAMKNIIIYTGAEISYVEFKNSTPGTTDPVYYSAMNGIVSDDRSETQYIYYENSYTINMYLTDLGKLSRMTGELPVSELVRINSFMVYDESTGNFVSDTNNNYLICEGNLSSTGNCYTFRLRYLSADYAGKLVKFKVYIRSPYYPDDCFKSFDLMYYVSGTENVTAASNAYNINYVLDGGKNNALNVDIYPQYAKDSMTDVTLQTPEKKGYVFDGWYTDSSFETEITKLDANLSGNISIYAKWIYSDTVYYSTDLTVDKVYNYSTGGVSEKDLTGLNFATSASLIYGESIKLKATFSMKDAIKAETFTFKYYFYINGELIKEISLIGSADMGSVQSVYYAELGGLGDANLAFPNLTVGNYQVEVVATAVIRHKFSINQTQSYAIEVAPKEVSVVYNANASIFTYDAVSHKPSASFSGYYAEDSSDFAELLFTGESKVDAGEYPYLVADITNNNYVLNAEDKAHEYWLYINKKPLTINWTTTWVYYNGKEQRPICEIDGLIGGDRASISLDKDGFIDAGTYRFIAQTVTNRNYSITENQPIDFEIKKAPITVKFDDVEERAQSSLAYRTQITFTVEGRVYDSIDSLGIVGTSEGLTKTDAGEYEITGTYDRDNSNYDISFVPGNYVLTGYYYVYYTLPNGEVVQELVNYGEKPVGVTEEMVKLNRFQKLVLSTELVETGDDIYVVVSVEDYTWYVVIGGCILGFIVLYLIVSRKARRNKVR